jgi:hypothetical protein
MKLSQGGKRGREREREGRENTYQLVGSKGPTPRLIIVTINIEFSSFPNPWMRLRSAVRTIALLLCMRIVRDRVIIVECFGRWMIAFEAAAVRLKAIERGHAGDGVVAVFIVVVVVVVVVAITVCSSRGVMTVCVGTASTIRGGCLIVTHLCVR